ncbi:MAG: AI-2E family transporter [Acidimicrobiia bacterium]|nr:AI-2E family transporter [Acidimicrobiia bacterium]
MNNTTDNSDSVESNDTLIDVQLSSTHSIFMKMPKWIPLAIAIFFLFQLIFIFIQDSIQALNSFFTIIIVSLFLSFAIEPAVNMLARRGMKRGVATGLVFLFLIIIIGLFSFAIVSLVIDEVTKLTDNPQDITEKITGFINSHFNTHINTDSLNRAVKDSKFLDTWASDAFSVGTSAVGVIFEMFTIALFTFYLVADAPKLRRALLRRLPTKKQEVVLNTWELAIDKTGGYIYSRTLLAVLSGISHYIFFIIFDVKYALALAVWVGFVSQFIPVIGTYIAGILPILIGFTRSPSAALWIFVFVFVYQQVENYLFAPRITARTMNMHPAVAFGAVIVGGSIFGTVGALLSLPAVAMLQAILSTHLGEHEIIDSPMTKEPIKRRKLRKRTKKESI